MLALYSHLSAWLYRDAEGQGMAEYGLILGLISIVVMVALTALGTKLHSVIDKVSAQF